MLEWQDKAHYAAQSHQSTPQLKKHWGTLLKVRFAVLTDLADVTDGTSADTDIDTDNEHFGKDVQKNFQSRDVSVPGVLVKTNNQHNSATHSKCFPSTTTYSSLDPLANKGSIRKFSSIRRNTKDSVAQEDVNEIQKLSEFPQYGDFMYYANDAVFNGVCGLCDAMIRDNAEVFAFHPRAAGNLSKHMYHPDCVYKAWKAGKPLPGQCPTCKTPVPLVSRVHAVIQIICRTLDKDRLEKRMKEWFSLGQSSNHWLVALDVYVRHAVYLKQTQKIIPFFDWWNRKHNNYPEIEVFPLVINKLRYEEKVQAEFLVKWVDKIVIVLQAALDIYEKFILFPDENLHENNYDTLVIEPCSKATRKNTAKVRKNGPASTDDCPVQSNTFSQARNSPTRPSSTYSPSHYSAKPAMILTADSIDSPNDPYTEPMKFLIDQLDYIVVSGEGLQGVWVKVQKTYLKHQELIARCNSAYRIRELIARNCPLQQDVMNRLLKSEANCLLILQNGAFHLISKYFDAEPMATLLKTTAQYDKFIWYSLNQRSDISILKVMAKYITKFSSEEIVEKFNFDLSIQRNIPYLNIILREISDCAFLVKIICDRFDETEWSKVAVLYTTLVELKCPIAVTYLLYHFMPSVEWNEYPAESAERTLLNSFTEVMEHVCLLLLEKRAAYLGKSLSLTSLSHPVVENYYDSLTCNYNPTLDLERIWNECTSVSISMMPNFSKWFVIALVGTGSHDRDDFLDDVRKLAPVLPGKFLAHQKRASISQNQQILVRNMVIEKGSLQYSASLCEFVVEMDKVVSELK